MYSLLRKLRRLKSQRFEINFILVNIPCGLHCHASLEHRVDDQHDGRSHSIKIFEIASRIIRCDTVDGYARTSHNIQALWRCSVELV